MHIISGTCRSLNAGIAGILLANGLITNARIHVSRSLSHSILVASNTDGEDIVIDMGGEQPLPLAIPIGEKEVCSAFYAERKNLFDSETITASAGYEEEGLRFTITDVKRNYVNSDLYSPASKTYPSHDLVLAGFRRYVTDITHTWRYGKDGVERFNHTADSDKRELVALLHQDPPPFEFVNSGGAYTVSVLGDN